MGLANTLITVTNSAEGKHAYKQFLSSTFQRVFSKLNWTHRPYIYQSRVSVRHLTLACESSRVASVSAWDNASILWKYNKSCFHLQRNGCCILQRSWSYYCSLGTRHKQTADIGPCLRYRNTEWNILYMVQSPLASNRMLLNWLMK